MCLFLFVLLSAESLRCSRNHKLLDLSWKVILEWIRHFRMLLCGQADLQAKTWVMTPATDGLVLIVDHINAITEFWPKSLCIYSSAVFNLPAAAASCRYTMITRSWLMDYSRQNGACPICFLDLVGSWPPRRCHFTILIYQFHADSRYLDMEHLFHSIPVFAT